jgi:hypothetical protein
VVVESLNKTWSEGLLMEIGYGYEQATKHRCPPPTAPPLEAGANSASPVDPVSRGVT